MTFFLYSDVVTATGVRLDIVSLVLVKTAGSLSSLRFLLRQCAPGSADVVTETALSVQDLQFPAMNPLLRELPPAVAATMLTGSPSTPSPPSSLPSTPSRSAATTPKRHRLQRRPRSQHSHSPTRQHVVTDAQAVWTGEAEVLLSLFENPGLALLVRTASGVGMGA